MPRPLSSRRQHADFVAAFRARQLDTEGRHEPGTSDASAKPATRRRAQLIAYLRWLAPHRGAAALVFGLAVASAGMEMVEPLFLRHIVDRVLLNTALDGAGKLRQLNLAGFTFLTLVILGKCLDVAKSYRQRLLNTQVMLTLRRALFRRFLHLPLPRLWDMKTGGILSRLSGDVDTTTGLLQMAVVSPLLSVLRLLVAIGILLSINWRLALTAIAIMPGAMLISFISAKRIRPIYRSIRKDAERVDGRVGETFSGVRVWCARSHASAMNCWRICVAATRSSVRNCSPGDANCCCGARGGCCSAS